MKAEVLLIVILILILLVWAVWFRITTKYHKRRYKNDETRRRTPEGSAISQDRERGIENKDRDLPRPSEPEGRGGLQTAETDVLGTTGNSIGKTDRTTRKRHKFLRRRR